MTTSVEMAGLFISQRAYLGVRLRLHILRETLALFDFVVSVGEWVLCSMSLSSRVAGFDSALDAAQ